jgi:hypothetical protein
VEWAIAAAKQYGTAAATTRNHFHVGSTGFYPRMAVREGCICFCFSSHRWMVPKDPASPPQSIADFENPDQVRKSPCRPRSWATFSHV